jgi:hypothetical protein
MESIPKTIVSWLFLIGIVIAIIVGLIFGANLWQDTNGYASLLLAILGFVIGILSFFAVGTITHDKVPTFLVAALILVLIGAISPWLAELNVIGPYLGQIATMCAIFVAPAAVLLAIRAIWDAGTEKEIEKILKIQK